MKKACGSSRVAPRSTCTRPQQWMSHLGCNTVQPFGPLAQSPGCQCSSPGPASVISRASHGTQHPLDSVGCVPRKRHVEALTLVPANVILFGNRVLAAVLHVR